jgi:pimeloyl-ACP methyl ester carboxylesterase
MEMIAAASRRMTDVRGVEQEMFEAGAGSPVLFLHPGRGLREAWPFIEALSGKARVIAPSHPGFGKTSLPRWMNTVEDLAHHYLDLMDALDLRDVTVVGSSFGGWIAAALAIKPTSRITRLVLIDPVGVKFGGREERDIVDIWAQKRADLDAMMFHDPAKGRIDYATLTDDDLQALARNRESEALFGWSPYMHDPKLIHRLHRIAAPTLVLWGASDKIVTPDYGRAYAAAIPGARFQMISEAGHFPHIEQPETCARLVGDFISQGG